MKKLISGILSWCFPLHKFGASWRVVLSLSILQPPHKHRRIKRFLAADLPLSGQYDPLLAWTVSLGICGIAVILLRLLLF